MIWLDWRPGKSCLFLKVMKPCSKFQKINFRKKWHENSWAKTWKKFVPKVPKFMRQKCWNLFRDKKSLFDSKMQNHILTRKSKTAFRLENAKALFESKMNNLQKRNEKKLEFAHFYNPISRLKFRKFWYVYFKLWSELKISSLIKAIPKCWWSLIFRV